jgi:hypothetical protein
VIRKDLFTTSALQAGGRCHGARNITDSHRSTAKSRIHGPLRSLTAIKCIVCIFKRYHLCTLEQMRSQPCGALPVIACRSCTQVSLLSVWPSVSSAAAATQRCIDYKMHTEFFQSRYFAASIWHSLPAPRWQMRRPSHARTASCAYTRPCPQARTHVFLAFPGDARTHAHANTHANTHVHTASIQSVFPTQVAAGAIAPNSCAKPKHSAKASSTVPCRPKQQGCT